MREEGSSLRIALQAATSHIVPPLQPLLPPRSYVSLMWGREGAGPPGSAVPRPKWLWDAREGCPLYFVSHAHRNDFDLITESLEKRFPVVDDHSRIFGALPLIGPLREAEDRMDEDASAELD